jgi:hypothetical protein
MSVVNVGYSRTQRWRIGSGAGVVVAVVSRVHAGLAVAVVAGVPGVSMFAGAETAGAEVVGTGVEAPDEPVHPAARSTAMARIAREKSMRILIVHRLYRDPIIFLLPLPGNGKRPQVLKRLRVQG